MNFRSLRHARLCHLLSRFGSSSAAAFTTIVNSLRPTTHHAPRGVYIDQAASILRISFVTLKMSSPTHRPGRPRRPARSRIITASSSMRCCGS